MTNYFRMVSCLSLLLVITAIGAVSEAIASSHKGPQIGLTLKQYQLLYQLLASGRMPDVPLTVAQTYQIYQYYTSGYQYPFVSRPPGSLPPIHLTPEQTHRLFYQNADNARVRIE